MQIERAFIASQHFRKTFIHHSFSSSFAVTFSLPQVAFILVFSIGFSIQARYQIVTTQSVVDVPFLNVPVTSYFTPATICRVILLIVTTSSCEFSPETNRAVLFLRSSVTS